MKSPKKEHKKAFKYERNSDELISRNRARAENAEKLFFEHEKVTNVLQDDLHNVDTISLFTMTKTKEDTVGFLESKRYQKDVKKHSAVCVFDGVERGWEAALRSTGPYIDKDKYVKNDTAADAVAARKFAANVAKRASQATVSRTIRNYEYDLVEVSSSDQASAAGPGGSAHSISSMMRGSVESSLTGDHGGDGSGVANISVPVGEDVCAKDESSTVTGSLPPVVLTSDRINKYFGVSSKHHFNATYRELNHRRNIMHGGDDELISTISAPLLRSSGSPNRASRGNAESPATGKRSGSKGGRRRGGSRSRGRSQKPSSPGLGGGRVPSPGSLVSPMGTLDGLFASKFADGSIATYHSDSMSQSVRVLRKYRALSPIHYSSDTVESSMSNDGPGGTLLGSTSNDSGTALSARSSALLTPLGGELDPKLAMEAALLQGIKKLPSESAKSAGFGITAASHSEKRFAVLPRKYKDTKSEKPVPKSKALLRGGTKGQKMSSRYSHIDIKTADGSIKNPGGVNFNKIREKLTGSDAVFKRQKSIMAYVSPNGDSGIISDMVSPIKPSVAAAQSTDFSGHLKDHSSDEESAGGIVADYDDEVSEMTGLKDFDTHTVRGGGAGFAVAGGSQCTSRAGSPINERSMCGTPSVSGGSPTNALLRLRLSPNAIVLDDDEFKDEVNLSTYEPNSPRAKFLAGCIKNNLPPRSLAILRQRFTTILNLEHHGLGDRFGAIFASGFALMPAVKVLNVADNNLTDVSLAPLLKAIQQSNSLEELNLSANKIGPKCAQSLAKYLSEPTCSLRFVKVSKAQLTDTVCALMTAALTHHCKVQELDLSSNLLGKDGDLLSHRGKSISAGESLGALLRSEASSELHTLKVQWNMIRGLGGIDLCESIRSSKSLTYLDISSMEL